MKRKISMLLLLVSAVIMVCGFRRNEDKVYDYAGLFTEDEKTSLQEDCVEPVSYTHLAYPAGRR